MAEFMMKDLVKKAGEEKNFFIKSSATSSEELGSPVHRGTRRVLDKYGILYSGKYAEKLTASDYGEYDYFIGMDKNNLRAMERIFGGDKEGKIYRLLDFSSVPKDVADPYWTGDFDATEKDVKEGVRDFYEFLKGQKHK